MADFKNIFKVVSGDQAASGSVSSGGDINELIQNDIASNKIMIYMKGSPDMPQCGFSAAVVEVLQKHGVPFASKDVLQDPALRQGIKDFSNWPTIPQIYVDGKFLGGCDILLEMDASGQLEPLIK